MRRSEQSIFVVLSNLNLAATRSSRLPMAAITRLVRLRRSSSIAKWFSSAVAAETNPESASAFHLNLNRPRREDPAHRNVQWIFLGCPGVGKGTYASRLCNLLRVPHIATGDLVRHELASSGPLSQQVSLFPFTFTLPFLTLLIVLTCPIVMFIHFQ